MSIDIIVKGMTETVLPIANSFGKIHLFLLTDSHTSLANILIENIDRENNKIRFKKFFRLATLMKNVDAFNQLFLCCLLDFTFVWVILDYYKHVWFSES